MPFRPGDPKPKGSGRQPGSRNKATRDFKTYVRSRLEVPEQVQADEREVLRHPSGPLSLYWHQMVYGKPIDRQEQSGTVRFVVELPPDD